MIQEKKKEESFQLKIGRQGANNNKITINNNKGNVHRTINASFTKIIWELNGFVAFFFSTQFVWEYS